MKINIDEATKGCKKMCPQLESAIKSCPQLKSSLKTFDCIEGFSEMQHFIARRFILVQDAEFP